MFVLVFAAYGLYQYFGGSINTAEYIASNTTLTTGQTNNQTITLGALTPTPTPARATPHAVARQRSEDEEFEGSDDSDTGTAAPAVINNPPATTVPAPTPVPVPTPVSGATPKGQYNNGTYMGSVADAYYGLVQVQVVVSGGKITDVVFIQYPNDRSTSRYLSGMAMPILKSEVIQAQNANVDAVSGASATSAAFQESLTSALTQAKA